MEQVTYQEAAELLGKADVTIRQAVMRKSLTKCALPKKSSLLLKEQVLLFRGKSGITERRLNSDELRKWEEYRDIALGKKEPVAPVKKETPTPIETITAKQVPQPPTLDSAIDAKIDAKLAQSALSLGDIIKQAIAEALKPQPLEKRFL